VNAKDPPLDEPLDVPPVVPPVPVPLVVDVVTRIPAEAVDPLVFPVAVSVWLPTGVSEGIVTEVLKLPEGSAVAVPTVAGSEWRTMVMVSPGWKLVPETVNEPPGGTVEVLRVRTGAFGPYANAGVAHRTPIVEIATIAKTRVSLPTLELPPFATHVGVFPSIVAVDRAHVKPLGGHAWDSGFLALDQWL
jgi:hypothetical protein